MSLIRKHGAVLQAWACLDLVTYIRLKTTFQVGTEFIRGISGGERKRTNIGMELIISPGILFLDEPTTGLDSSTASAVMSLLRRYIEASGPLNNVKIGLSTIRKVQINRFHVTAGYSTISPNQR